MIDLIVEAINNRFQQKGFNMSQKLETAVTVQLPQLSEVIKDVEQTLATLFKNSLLFIIPVKNSH